MVDILILKHFFRLEAPSRHLRGTFEELLQLLCSVSEALQGAAGSFRWISMALRTLTHAFDRSEKAPDKDKN
ncbi:MAG: hypothetical protein IJM24_07715 [Clostridia bacterium]|nr:hypothetical protein [Clostridia bacterium]